MKTLIRSTAPETVEDEISYAISCAKGAQLAFDIPDDGTRYEVRRTNLREAIAFLNYALEHSVANYVSQLKHK